MLRPANVASPSTAACVTVPLRAPEPPDSVSVMFDDAAVTAFTRALQIATNDPTTRFNRAYAYLQSGRLDEARADYAALQTVFTNAYQVAYGLGDVAWRQRQTNEAVRNYQIYLTNAPANAAEIALVRDRLKQLQKK